MSNHSSLSTSPARSSVSTTAIVGANAPSSLAVEEFHLSADLTSFHDRKDEALLVLKSDLMAVLNKEVKLLDEDNWMFEGPRSRINNRAGGFFPKDAESVKHKLAPEKHLSAIKLSSAGFTSVK